MVSPVIVEGPTLLNPSLTIDHGALQSPKITEWADNASGEFNRKPVRNLQPRRTSCNFAEALLNILVYLQELYQQRTRGQIPSREG